MNCGVTCYESDGVGTETDSITEIYFLLSSFYSHMYSSHICYHINHNPCYTYCYSNTELRAMQLCRYFMCQKFLSLQFRADLQVLSLYSNWKRKQISWIMECMKLTNIKIFLQSLYILFVLIDLLLEIKKYYTNLSFLQLILCDVLSEYPSHVENVNCKNKFLSTVSWVMVLWFINDLVFFFE